MIKAFFKNSERNRSLKVGGFYAGASMFNSVVNMITGIVIIRWLAPAELGLWQTFTMFQVYFSVLEFGIPNGLNRELPFLMGKGDTKAANDYAAAAAHYSFTIASFWAILTIIATAATLAIGIDLNKVAGVFALGCTVTIIALQRFLVVTFRSSQSFEKLSKAYLYNSVSALVFFPLVYLFKYYGLLAYNIIVPLLNVIRLYRIRPIRVRPVYNFGFLKHLAFIGTPVYIMNIIRGVAQSFVRITLLHFGGTIAVGTYTPVAAIGSILNLFPTVFANMFFPKMTHRFGQTGDPKTLWSPVWKTLLVLFLINIPVVIGIWVFTPYMITNYFPDYKEAISAMQVVSLSLLFSGGLVTHNCLYSIKAYRVAAIYSITELVLLAIVPYVMAKINPDQILLQVAKSIVITGVLLFSLNFILLRYALYSNKYILKRDV